MEFMLLLRNSILDQKLGMPLKKCPLPSIIRKPWIWHFYIEHRNVIIEWSSLKKLKIIAQKAHPIHALKIGSFPVKIEAENKQKYLNNYWKKDKQESSNFNQQKGGLTMQILQSFVFIQSHNRPHQHLSPSFWQIIACNKQLKTGLYGRWNGGSATMIWTEGILLKSIRVHAF